MSVEQVKVPRAGESITEATVNRWLKPDGDYVNVDDPLVELGTDKASQEVRAPGVSPGVRGRGPPTSRSELARANGARPANRCRRSASGSPSGCSNRRTPPPRSPPSTSAT